MFQTIVRRRSGVQRWRCVGSRRTDVGDLLVKELVCLIRTNGSRYRSTTATNQSVDRAPQQLPGSRMFRVDSRLQKFSRFLLSSSRYSRRLVYYASVAAFTAVKSSGECRRTRRASRSTDQTQRLATRRFINSSKLSLLPLTIGAGRCEKVCEPWRARYNGGLGAEPPAGVQGAEPPVGGQGGKAPLKLKPF